MKTAHIVFGTLSIVFGLWMAGATTAEAIAGHANIWFLAAVAIGLCIAVGGLLLLRAAKAK